MAGDRQQMSDDDGWKPADFLKAVPGGDPVQRWGYERRGLALQHGGWAAPRTSTKWTLIHLGSGAAILGLIGNVYTVMPVASQIAEATDWTLFDLPEGWRQTDPDLPTKIAEICEANRQARPDLTKAEVISDADARAVIAARES